MPGEDLARRADFNALNAGTHSSLLLIRDWTVFRANEWQTILGSDGIANVIQQELVMLALAELGYGRRWQIKFYQDQFGRIGSRGTIRKEIYALADRNLFLIGTDPADRRGSLIYPTLRLVMWAQQSIPRLERSLQLLVVARHKMAP